ncbi:MAG: carboxypeptidase-like regulatory domain-containing protein [Bacteroidetes bacterium]|nr:carboxypeptidase-like regulatory domain-containing protein [Bacteroidota bacterium]
MNDRKISIATPCHENWDSMTPSEQGRFCSKCSKTVLDATQFYDQDVIQKFDDNHGNLCIRIETERLYTPASPKPRISIFKTVAASLLLFLLKIPLVKAILPQSSDSIPTPDTIPDIKRITIKGQVLDSFQGKEPMPFANIAVKQGDSTLNGTFSDLNGYFSITIDFVPDPSKKLWLECEYLGFQKFSKVLNPNMSAIDSTVYMKEESIDLRVIEIVRDRDVQGRMVITMGGGMMGAMSVERADLDLLKPYDTKTYTSEELERYNLRW